MDRRASFRNGLKNFRSDNFLSILKGKIDFIDTALLGMIYALTLKKNILPFPFQKEQLYMTSYLKPNNKQIFHLKKFRSIKRGI